MYLIDYRKMIVVYWLQVIKMNRVKEEKRIIDLEYNLICDFIRLRNELGLSQQKMADEVGIVREMIAVIENRKKHPQINTLIRILEPFGYTLSITKIESEKYEAR